MEQVDQLERAQEFEEAINSLIQLYDQSAGQIIEAEQTQKAATLVVKRYVSVRHWSQWRLGQLLKKHPAAKEKYLASYNAAGAAAWAAAHRSKQIEECAMTAERFAHTDAGPKLQHLLTDRQLERGWGIAALQTIQRILPELRVAASKDQNEFVGTLSWPTLAHQLTDEALGEAVKHWYLSAKSTGAIDSDQELAELLKRILDASELTTSGCNAQQLRRWLGQVAVLMPENEAKLLQSHLDKTSYWKAASDSQGDWLNFAGNNARLRATQDQFDPAGWPSWHQPLERYTGSSDRNPASRPRVGESELGILPYHPTVHEQRIYINELHRIIAFDLKSGKMWPSPEPPLPLFDSHIAPSAMMPLGYPMVGVPRGTLTIHDRCLYARLGSPVTGWASGQMASDGASMGYLVGLDLTREGSLLPGFPLRLADADFSGAEPEGCPLVQGNQLIVAVIKRDNVGFRRSVAAFDRFSGKLIWKSPVLASGPIDGTEHANLLSHQLLTEVGGRLFYNTNLGAIACLDTLNGQVEWLVRYRRSLRDKQAFPQPDRFRYRDLTPCAVDSGLVYCAPQDCPEMFALDAITGDLVWSTNEASVADAIHVLGTSQRQLIVAGDRITWLDKLTGTIEAQFPAATTSGHVNALPNPRGMGRGCISGNEVYWPTQNEIYVFSAQQPARKAGQLADSPAPVRRIRLDTRGAEGGNLVAAKDALIIASPSRIMTFLEKPPAKPVAKKIAENH